VGNLVVTQTGDQLVNELGDLIGDSMLGSPVVVTIARNGTTVGTIQFNPGQRNAVFGFPANVSFSPGDLFEIVGAVNNAGLGNVVWNVVVS